jgi:oligoendopeptidase F
MPAERIPERSEVPKEFQWNLSRLFASDEEWERGLEHYEQEVAKIGSFKGTLGLSAENLRKCLDFMNEVEKLDERTGYYAQLRLSEDAGSGKNQERFARYMSIATRAQAEASYQIPEIQSVPNETMEGFLEDPLLEAFGIALRKVLRFKPHVLSEKEEKLLALQSEANQTAMKSYSALTDVDLDFGSVETPDGARPLSQSTFRSFMIHPDREVRRRAYMQFYGRFDGHKNTLASLYAGSVHLDVYKAKVRDYPSSRAASLFPDKVPESVYDNLIDVVGRNLGALHSYYRLRRDALEVKELRHYDVYVPVVKDIKVKHSYEEAVELVVDSLATLGPDYCRDLKKGLLGGWVDRYENKGKRSGAFSAGSYVGDPHILMNYKEDVLRDVFTVAHEGGHSMHSLYSVRANPFQHYQYSIFEAEVASTFNEQLLLKYLMDRERKVEMRAYLVGKQIDDIIGTIYRQTMFAEFEHKTHAMVEGGTPLTVDSLRTEYRKLLAKYFGSEVVLEECSDLEGLRIPHFYRAFYVYKYSTGLAAAIALAERIAAGGEAERRQYTEFLESGGSRYPLESLGIAGVDMSRPEQVQSALETFQKLVDQLADLLPQFR